ncbi:hypothetical protein R3P38DRAFT_2874666 [Favolaschia claudopus]|uniref:Uncharacterized protein n=1 Tax=Favolaschia claudopus TaxID=2862362 RepID=A0AAW0D4Y1_9AGAR
MFQEHSKEFMFASMISISGIPVSHFSTPTIPANSHPPTITLSKPPTPGCSSPEFDSDVHSYSTTWDAPMNSSMQRGDGPCSYSGYGVSLDDGSLPSRIAPRLLRRTKTLWNLRTPGAESPSTPPISLHKKPSHLCLPKAADDSSAAASSSGSLSRKPSLFSLRAWPSKNSLRSSEGSSGEPSRCSSPIPPVSQEKPLAAPLTSPCASPMSDLDSTRKVDFSPAPPSSPKFRIKRKPVPQYFSDPPLDTDCSSSADSSGSEDAHEASGALQLVGPNVFIAYDDDESILALAPAFTHVIRLVPASNAIHSQTCPNVSFSPETGIHTLHLHIPPPDAPSHPSGDFCAIDESSEHIQFGSSLPRNHLLVQPLTETILLSNDGDFSTIQLQSSCFSGDLRAETLLKDHPVSYTDLVATQEFLASSGRFVTLPELAHLLSDGPANPPPLGLQLIHIDLVLSFLRPHPFAPSARRRVLLLTPRGLALEGLALMACYIARVEGCSLRFALRKFEGSVGTVNKSWRGLLGNDAVVATYLENLLLA